MAAPISSSSASSRAASDAKSPQMTYRGPFAIMTLLFYVWGFMTVWNDLLIPRFKEAFTLTYFQAMLVQCAFFGAYAVGSLIYYLIGVQGSFIVPILAFAYVAFYGGYGYRAGRATTSADTAAILAAGPGSAAAAA